MLPNANNFSNSSEMVDDCNMHRAVTGDIIPPISPVAIILSGFLPLPLCLSTCKSGLGSSSISDKVYWGLSLH